MSEADARISSSMQNIASESGRSMGAAKGSTKDEEGGMNDLYKINQVYFKMLPTLSLVAKRTLLVNQAQKSSYLGTNDTIIFTFNTGEYYISGPSSYLLIRAGFRNDLYGNAKAILSQGNILQLFEEVTFTTASGTEVCRELNKGLHSAFTFRYNNTQEYIDTIGQVQGAATGKYSRLHDGVAPTPLYYGTTLTNNLDNMFPTLGGREGVVKPWTGDAAKAFYGISATNLNKHATGIAAGAGQTFVPGTPNLDLDDFIVPLDQVLGLFKLYLGTLFPAGALSGGRLEMRLKNAMESLQYTDAINNTDGVITPGVASVGLANLVNGAAQSIRIDRAYLVLDAFQLQDNVLKRLNTIAAGQDGLTCLFDTYDQVITPFAGQGSVECQVQQARSRIVRSWCVVRDQSSINNPYINSLAAEAACLRVAAQVPPGSRISDANVPAGGSGWLGTGFYGGINIPTLRTVVSTSTTMPTILDATTAGTFYNVLQQQPGLPNDPYSAETHWGGPLVTSFQTQLGALFFPQQPITTLAEHYQNALYVMCKGIPDKDNTCSVSFEDFKGGLGAYLYGTAANAATDLVAVGVPYNPSTAVTYRKWVAPYGLAIYGFLAEKSQALQLSGLPIASARLLRHKFTFDRASISGNRQITTFTQFTRLMKTFLGGRVVVRE